MMDRITQWLLALLLSATPVIGQTTNGLSARAEVDARADHFKTRLYLTNTTDSPITVTVGSSGVKTTMPRFQCELLQMQASTFQPFGREAPTPLTLTIPAKCEVLYDEYFLPYPRLKAGKHQLRIGLPLGRKSEDVLTIWTEIEIPEEGQQGGGHVR